MRTHWIPPTHTCMCGLFVTLSCLVDDGDEEDGQYIALYLLEDQVNQLGSSMAQLMSAHCFSFQNGCKMKRVQT